MKETLLEEFKIRQSKVKTSVENMLYMARKASEGQVESSSPNDVFRQDD